MKNDPPPIHPDPALSMLPVQQKKACSMKRWKELQHERLTPEEEHQQAKAQEACKSYCHTRRQHAEMQDETQANHVKWKGHGWFQTVEGIGTYTAAYPFQHRASTLTAGCLPQALLL